MPIDLFNSHKLAQALADRNNLSQEKNAITAELGSLAVKHATLEKERDELKAQLAKIEKSEAEDSRITFYIDNKLMVRLDTKINRDITDVLVAEGYLGERDISNELAHHLAFLIMANELCEQLIDEYSGEPVDAGELADSSKPEAEEE